MIIGVALEYSKLPDDPEQLKQLLLQHSLWVEALRSEVLRLRRWRFGSSAEVIDVRVAPELPFETNKAIPAPPITDPPTAAVPAKLAAVASIQPPRERAWPARMLPTELPRLVCVHKPASCNCPDCGKQMRSLGEDQSEQLDYVPGYFQVICHIRPKLICRDCERIVQAPAAARPIERGLPTAGLLAQVISAKYADHLPLYRQEGIYRRSGVQLPRAMLASWVAEAAQLLDPLVSELERYAMSGSKLHADDTPVPVLAPGKGRTRTARLWAYVRDDRPSSGVDPPAVVYRYSPDRRSERPQAHLRCFAGVLQADGYSGFNALYAGGRIVEAACWAHARRKYYDVYTTERSPSAGEALIRIGELYAIEREIRGQLPDIRREARQARAVPKLLELQAWLKATPRTLSIKSELAGAIQYTLTRWPQLMRYTADGSIEIDNNAAERAIRALVLGRRNYLFAGSDAGGATAARLYSLIGSCRLNGIDPHLYLRYVLERIASHPINRIVELLPWQVAPRLMPTLARVA